MKLTLEFLSQAIKSAIQERDKARTIYDRQQGVINFCDYLLKNMEAEVSDDRNSASTGSSIESIPSDTKAKE